MSNMLDATLRCGYRWMYLWRWKSGGFYLTKCMAVATLYSAGVYFLWAMTLEEDVTGVES